MTAAIIAFAPGPMVALLHDARTTLASAETAAEILDARDMAGAVYSQAKAAARFAKAKGAADAVIATAHRAQADALEIEAAARRRLADEYDAARIEKEVQGHGGARNFKVANDHLEKPALANLGLTKEEIRGARKIRDAEQAAPGIVRRTVDRLLAVGAEPTRAALNREMRKELPTPPPRMPKVIAKPPPPRRHAREKSTPTSRLTAAGAWFIGALDEFDLHNRQDGKLAAFVVNLSDAQRVRMGEIIPTFVSFLNQVESYLKGETNIFDSKEEAR